MVRKKILVLATIGLGLGCGITGGMWLHTSQQVKATQHDLTVVKQNRIKALQATPRVVTRNTDVSQIKYKGQQVLDAQAKLIAGDTKIFVPYVDNSQGWHPATTPWGFKGDTGQLVIGTFDDANSSRNVAFIYRNDQQQIATIVTAQYQDGKFINLVLNQTKVGYDQQQQMQNEIMQRHVTQ